MIVVFALAPAYVAPNPYFCAISEYSCLPASRCKSNRDTLHIVNSLYGPDSSLPTTDFTSETCLESQTDNTGARLSLLLVLAHFLR